jgi:ring-1,2-phenylacetyl-CoA epoxidase subunit PaaD
MVNEAAVRARLAEVKDPEIPACSITDLGIVERVAVREDAIEVDLVPTFAGCPALDVIRSDVERAVAEIAGGKTVAVRFVMSPPWTTDRIAPEARAAMGTLGIAGPVMVTIGRVACPYCGSADTELSSSFGPTPCRSIRYCNACRNPFEGFKEKR